MRALVIGSVLLVAVSLIGIGVFTLRTRTDLIGDGLRETSRIASVLGLQIEASVRDIDATLIDLQHLASLDYIATHDVFERLFTADTITAMLRSRRASLPQVTDIVVTDADGLVLNGTVGDIEHQVSIGDRPYFRRLKHDLSNELVISDPVVSRLRGHEAVVFARRLSNANGLFLGVVLAAVPTSYLERIYAPVRSIESIRLTLLRLAGSVLIRSPAPDGPAADAISRSSPWHAVVRQGGGQYLAEDESGDGRRWVSVHVLDQVPLVLNVSVSEEVLLARWYHRSLFNVGGASALLLCTVLLLVFVLHQFRALVASEASACAAEAAAEEKSSALAVANMRLDAALENLPQGLGMFDRDSRLVVANRRFAEIYHLAPWEVMPGTPMATITDRRIAKGTAAINPGEDLLGDNGAATVRLQQLADGRMIQARAHPLADGGWLTTHTDVTDRHLKDSKIAYMARHDLLTGLYNRAAFSELIEESGARLRRRGEAFCVFLLDLDRFKHVNDTLGHPAGDALLKMTAQRLKATVRETDVVARLGGDEFAIIQAGTEDQGRDADGFAARIFACLAEPFDVEGQSLIIGASIGIAFAPLHGTLPDELMRRADLALYRSKALGRNTHTVFSTDLELDANVRQKMEADLRAAIAAEALDLVYQPLIDLRTRRVCGAEALLRWRHPERGVVAPSEFIPLAEDTGLIERIGQWVLLRACQDAAGWPGDVKVAVNLSPMQFRKGNLLDTILCALVESGLAPERLEVEITESVLLDAELAHSGVVRQLKNLGVSVALDDFGTGYASLSYLTMLPFDKIKIDRSFIAGLHRADCTAIVASVVTLARGLGMATVAEGIETTMQLDLVRAAGVDLGQGYLLGRPCAAADLPLAGTPDAPARAA